MGALLSTGLWNPGLPAAGLCCPALSGDAQAGVGQCQPPLVSGAGIRLAEVSEPDLDPGVSFGCTIGQVCIWSKGLGCIALGWARDYAREPFWRRKAGRSGASPSSLGLISEGQDSGRRASLLEERSSLLGPAGALGHEDFDVQLQPAGSDLVAALDQASGLAGMPAPVRLDDAGRLAGLEEAPAGLPHADLRLHLHHGPLLAGVEPQRQAPSLLQHLGLHGPPPALDDPGAQRRVQQRLAHHDAAPPRLDPHGRPLQLGGGGKTAGCSAGTRVGEGRPRDAPLIPVPTSGARRLGDPGPLPGPARPIFNPPLTFRHSSSPSGQTSSVLAFITVCTSMALIF